jgi:large subunit ribosomal protein L24
MLIKSGDLVEVRSGDSRGVRGKVLAVRPGKAAGAGPRVVVEGVNRVYRHIKRSQKNPQGGRRG